MPSRLRSSRKTQPVSIRGIVNHAVTVWYGLTGQDDVPYRLLMAVTIGVLTDKPDNWQTYVTWRLRNAATMVPTRTKR